MSRPGAGTLPRLAERLCRATDRAREREASPDHWPAWADPPAATDLRWRSLAFDPGAATGWYAGLAVEEQARYCLERVCTMLLVGADFETQLIRGLEVMAGDTGWVARYCRAEAEEEAQHCAMFRRFVAVVAPDLVAAHERADVMAGVIVRSTDGVADAVATLARDAPVLFLWSVLCGEEPIDALQRWFLAGDAGRDAPRLLAEICRHHVSDEARHLRFARALVAELTHAGGPRTRRRVELFLPEALDRATRYILSTPGWFIDRWGIPSDETCSAEWARRDMAMRRRAARRLVDFAVAEGFVRPHRLAQWIESPIEAPTPAELR